MLVLSRKSREAVVIGGSKSMEPTLRVTVLQIRGDVVRLGFETTKAVGVHRQEVWERIRADQLPAQPSTSRDRAGTKPFRTDDAAACS